jgi:hypothetical protein
MVGEAIANWGSYVDVAIGLFVAGLFAIMVYERTSAKSSQKQPAAADQDDE